MLKNLLKDVTKLQTPAQTLAMFSRDLNFFIIAKNVILAVVDMQVNAPATYQIFSFGFSYKSV